MQNKKLNNDFDRVACIVNVLTHFNESLGDEAASMMLLGSDRVLRQLVEIESPSAYLSPLCTFSVESMHVCRNRKCTELGKRL
jgi:hypothetical protein